MTQEKNAFRIPLFKPWLGNEELEEIKSVFESGWVGLGPKTTEFENALGQYLGVKNVVGTNSCTSALHLALEILNVRGKEVLLPALTFVSTAHAVIHAGGKPVWVDVEEDTLCMDPEDLNEKITKKSACVIPVHYAGHPCEMDTILKIARDNDLGVVEDAAQAMGAEYRHVKIGALDSDLTCFSFHATKNITTGEGGAITTNSETLARRLRKLRFLGADRDTWTRLKEARERYWHFVCESVGYKYYMNDVTAAIGIAQLRKIDKILERKRYLFSRYSEMLAKIPDVEIPVVRNGVLPSAYAYVIKCENRDALMEYLGACGITTGVHYMPVHMHPPYRKYRKKLPVTEEIWHKILTIPLYYELKDAEQDYIVEKVHEFYKK